MEACSRALRASSRAKHALRSKSAATSSSTATARPLTPMPTGGRPLCSVTARLAAPLFRPLVLRGSARLPVLIRTFANPKESGHEHPPRYRFIDTRAAQVRARDALAARGSRSTEHVYARSEPAAVQVIFRLRRC